MTEPATLWADALACTLLSFVAAHIARQAVAELDAEWADLQRQIGGAA